MPMHKSHDRCRVCGGTEMWCFLDLGEIPLVNRFPEHKNAHDPKFPLRIMLCQHCKLSQLDVVVDPNVLYADYPYRSSVSETFRQHCEGLAREHCRLKSDDLVVEIASNDGCFLNEFKRLGSGCNILGVEPASNLAEIANANGIPTANAFWNRESANDILSTYGDAKLIVAMNVLAHVDEIHPFLNCVRSVLASDGRFVFEVPYMGDFLDKTEFDTAYHEHLSYFLLKPLKMALEMHGLYILNVKFLPIHGGSIRVTCGMGEEDGTLTDALKHEEEMGYHTIMPYAAIGNRVKHIKEELVGFLTAMKLRGHAVAAYGASAKGNVLLNYCGIDGRLLQYVVDDTPQKQGRLYAGNHLPIVSRDFMRESPVDYLLVLAWNFADEMIAKTPEFRENGGRYIIPIPALHVRD